MAPALNAAKLVKTQRSKTDLRLLVAPQQRTYPLGRKGASCTNLTYLAWIGEAATIETLVYQENSWDSLCILRAQHRQILVEFQGGCVPLT